MAIRDKKTIMLVVTAEQTASLFVSGFAARLARDGHRVVVVADSLSRLAESAEQSGVELAPVPMRRSPSPLSDLHSLFALLRVTRRVRPDILTYATPKASLLGSVAGRLAGIRTRVYQLWGLRLETVTGLGRGALSAIELLTSRLSTSIVANSPSLRNRYLDLSLNGGRNVSVLGLGSSHGVDLQRFSRDAPMPALDDVTASFLQRTEGMTIGFIGRLHPDKGVFDLKEAARICLSRGHRVRLLIVGPDEGIADYLKDDEDVPMRLTGETEDPRPYLAAMDVLCLPSLREGFPNVVLEAGAMGRASVVSDATGAVDSVIDGSTGIVTPAGDADELAKALIKLATDPQLLASLGQGAFDHVRTNFDQFKVWDALANYLLSQSQT